jgi:penicillin-binding protein A
MRSGSWGRWLTLAPAIALIGYGIIQPVEADVTWLICLWSAAPLLALWAWISQPPLPRGLTRSLYNLGLVVLVGFSLLSLQLLRQQFVRSNAIYNHVVIGTDGSTTSNVRPVLASQRILRGRIEDRLGRLLVDSEAVDGFARRTYPLTAFADPRAFSNVVGFFSRRYGQSGLEASHATDLTGERGSELDRLQDQLFGRQQRGNNLRLTLNAAVQTSAFNALGGRTGSVVVLDPRTGAVIALASTPGFDPSQLAFDPSAPSWAAEDARIDEYWRQLLSDSAGQPLLNRPTQGRYPPGSIYKTVTAVGTLENPANGQPDTITCPEQFVPDPNAPPVVNAVANLASRTGDPATLESVYAFSCNTAFAQYAVRLQPDGMIDIAGRFDIFTPQRSPRGYTEFNDLPTAESLLYVDPGFLNQPRGLADTGYGQGQLLVTPLQMALVAAAIANDGVMMRPYLVQQVTRPDGSMVREYGPRSIRRTMATATARRMRDYMSAVARFGFGSSVSDYVPGIAVGGKSGTAEHVPGAVPHAWFIAIAPIEEPRYAVAVMVESGGEGSSVGAALAGQVLAAAFANE